MRWWRHLIDRITGADRRRAAYLQAVAAYRAEQAAGRQSILDLAEQARRDRSGPSNGTTYYSQLTTHGQRTGYRTGVRR
ncbi:MAG TPA: hypothetical protein VFR67_06015 [Pilimelia sp.]|nr:hypothetical protein [Pilimelia sp.]